MLGMLLDIGKATAYINFGAFLAFALVNVAFLVWIWRSFRARSSMARAALLSLVPIAGFAVDLYLFSKLHPEAYAIGGGWLVLGLAMLGIATRGFRRPVPVLSER
jgi:hypothetical protein